MQRTRRTLGWTLAAALVVALAATSFTALAKPVLGRQIAGSYRVVMMYQGQEFPHLATFTSNGAVIATFMPMVCGGDKASATRSFTVAHGSWDVVMRKGRPVLVFNLLSDEWVAPLVVHPDGRVDGKGAHGGVVQVVGRAPLSGLPVKGQASISFQGGCGGVKEPFLVSFTAESIPAASNPPEPEKPTDQAPR